MTIKQFNDKLLDADFEGVIVRKCGTKEVLFSGYDFSVVDFRLSSKEIKYINIDWLSHRYILWIE